MSTASSASIRIERSEKRKHFDFGWLQSAYSFSHSNYYNPQKMCFGTLRVLNEEVMAANSGFNTHEHKNMEVLTFVLDGEMKVQEMGKKPVIIGTNEVHFLSSGSGVQHLEANASKEEGMEFIQLWILPSVKETEPIKDQRYFEEKDGLTLVASPNGDESSFALKQDTFIYRGKTSGNAITHSLNEPENWMYVFVISGELKIGEETLERRDAAEIKNLEDLTIKSTEDCEFLLIETPKKAIRR